MAAVAADRNLLFGLLALQNGLINQSQLVAAFQAWTLDKARALADHFISLGHLNDAERAVVEAMAALHVQKSGDVEQSLAVIPAGRSTREKLARLGDPQVNATLALSGSCSTDLDADPDRTSSYAVGTVTSEGQRFRVLRPHAQGGLGAVFVALDTELHREVALKQILDQHADDAGSRTRFLIEAEITGGLEHPGIVPVYGLGTYGDGRPYYAMRFIRGDSLKEAIGRFHADEALRRDPGRRSLELRKLLRRFLDVCNAIEYAHSRGVLHRDIKPGNIIVGRHGETLIVDWGLAKASGRAEPGSGERTLMPSSASGSAETLPGSALGTPAYMSPEQAEGQLDRLGPRSDVYSLGASLYSLLTSKPPFEGDVADIIRAVQRGEFRPPRRLDATIDAALEAVCLKAMALKPEDRYGSGRALADDIERWMADEPISAWREPAFRRARRWARRNRTAVTAAAVAVLAMLVGLGAVAGVQARANVELKKANNAKDLALEETRKAQAATQAALRQSEESRQQAEAVSKFLVEAFRSPDPSQDGRQVKVADVLDRVSAKLDKDFAGSPATKGALLNALGETYFGLGLFDRAMNLIRKSADIREAALGTGHPDTLTSYNNLAVSYMYAGQLQDALVLHQKTLRLRESALGSEHADTLLSRNNLGEAYWTAGRVPEAIAVYEEALKLRKAVLGPDHPDTLSTQNDLGLAHCFAGRTREAIALLEPTLKLREASLGHDHPDTLTTKNNLAEAYWTAGQVRRATELFEETFRVREAKLGPDHPDTLTSCSDLAVAYGASGRLQDAIALHQTTLKLREAKLGPDHPNTLQSRNNLAVAYFRAGQVQDAIALHQRTLELRETKLGPDHPETLRSRNNLAYIYELVGRVDDAERLRRVTLARRRKTTKTGDPFVAHDLFGLSALLLRQSRWSEAEPLLNESLAILQKATPDDWRRHHAMSLLGGALLGQGRYADAESLVVPGYEGLKAREASINVSDRVIVREAAERVIRLYENWGKAELATAWKSKLGLHDLPADVFAQP
jgi:serine/threonine protein kinase/tetratricopeptide (TPR) repeat protein